jgi:hypothetical protein
LEYCNPERVGQGSPTASIERARQVPARELKPVANVDNHLTTTYQEINEDIWLFREVEWPAVPREGEEVDVRVAYTDPVTVERIRWQSDGVPIVSLEDSTELLISSTQSIASLSSGSTAKRRGNEANSGLTYRSPYVRPIQQTITFERYENIPRLCGIKAHPYGRKTHSVACSCGVCRGTDIRNENRMHGWLPL